MRQVIASVAAITIFLLSLSQSAFAAGMWEEGRHYKELPLPVKTRDASKIEVVEVFWYGCPHCYDFAKDHLPEWEKNLPADVDFVLMPATFSNWRTHAKAYFAAEALGVVDKLHMPLFEAINPAPKKVNNVESFKKTFTENGVKAEDYDAVFKASGFRKISKVDEALKKAEEKTKAYRLTGVPGLIVNGKYSIGVSDAGSFQNMIKIANYLISQERQKMASQPK
jgi:thiol:disulfide interchange protein DsbA